MLKHIMRNRDGLLARRLAKICDRMLKAYENVNYDHDTNGESLVLRCMSEVGAKVIFDVGANVGHYTRAALQAVPGAQVYAFEIAPETFAQLKAGLGDADRATLVNLGLSSETGKLRVKYPAPLSTRTSAFDWPDHKDYAWLDADVVAGDAFCAEHGIQSIDFLKMDVEGAEHLVLRGFGRMLESGSIRAIQFEYGYVNILSRFLLTDFYALLAKHGYQIGKLYPRGVHFKAYALQDENFWGPNYVAVREGDADLIRRLSIPR